MAHQIGDLGAPDLILAGQAVRVRAGTADQLALDNGGAMSRLGHVPSQKFTSFTAAEDKHFIALRVGRHRLLLLQMALRCTENLNRTVEGWSYGTDGRAVSCLHVAVGEDIGGHRQCRAKIDRSYVKIFGQTLFVRLPLEDEEDADKPCA